MYVPVVGKALQLKEGQLVRVTWNYFWFLSNSQTMRVRSILKPRANEVIMLCTSEPGLTSFRLTVKPKVNKVEVKCASADRKLSGKVTGIRLCNVREV